MDTSSLPESVSKLGELSKRVQVFREEKRKREVRSITLDSSEVAEASARIWTRDAKVSWIGSTQADYVSRIRSGANPREIVECEALMAQFAEGIVIPETMGRIKERSVYGSMISVPEYLSGSPTCFRRRKHRENDMAPVRIFAPISGSAYFSAGAIRNRALGMLSLALHLQRYRPIELFLYTASCESFADATGQRVGEGVAVALIRLGLSPVDLSTAVALCGSSATSRGFLFALKASLIGWESALPIELNTREALQAEPTDIVGPIMHASYDRDEPVVAANKLLRSSGLIPAD